MILMWVLCLVVVAGVVAIWRWAGMELARPWEIDGSDQPIPPATVIKRYLWYVTVMVGAGVVSGLVMLGAGGRLAMRLLAITGGTRAQSRVTEANEIVGRITFDGTIGSSCSSA
jgi:hypothetical protein